MITLTAGYCEFNETAAAAISYSLLVLPSALIFFLAPVNNSAAADTNAHPELL